MVMEIKNWSGLKTDHKPFKKSFHRFWRAENKMHPQGRETKIQAGYCGYRKALATVAKIIWILYLLPGLFTYKFIMVFDLLFLQNIANNAHH